MTIAELIKHLQTFDQGLLVAYQIYSERCLLETRDLKVERAQEPRADGWVGDFRPDKPSREYLMFPGN